MTAPALTQYIQGQNQVGADQLNTFAQTCDDTAQLRELIGTSGMQVLVRGVLQAGDGGAGSFYWVEGSTANDDGYNIIVPDGATGVWSRINANVASALTILAGSAVTLASMYAFVYTNKTTNGTLQISLPAEPIPNVPIVVIDAKGDAASFPITLLATGGLTINGGTTSTTSIINTNFGSKRLIFNGEAWSLW